MKTTIDLPDNLVREIKIRAVLERRKFKEKVTDLLQQALQTPSEPDVLSTSEPLGLTTDPQTRLPLIRCRHAARADDLSPDRIAEILLNQEVTGIDRPA